MELIYLINSKFYDRPNIKCQNGPVLPHAQVFYSIGQALLIKPSATANSGMTGDRNKSVNQYDACHAVEYRQSPRRSHCQFS
jgi:hypothetical protein